jgi:Protein of unknown function (DUF3024)
MFDIIQTADIIEACENLLQKRRPPENIRHQVDLNYRIDNQSVLIFEVRSRWDKTNEFFESPIAKTTWVKSKNCWKVFWLRADLKWHSYKPVATVKSISEFVKLVDQDKHGCFWG